MHMQMAWAAITMTPEIFDDIESVSHRIMAKFPKDENVYIALGRSPAPFEAYLSTEDNADVWNIPLSSFRYGVTDQVLTPEQETVLFEHFDRYFPKSSELNGRSVVLMDY